MRFRRLSKVRTSAPNQREDVLNMVPSYYQIVVANPALNLLFGSTRVLATDRVCVA
jgi:hypothetical protein